jgi:GH18 family chitinase
MSISVPAFFFKRSWITLAVAFAAALLPTRPAAARSDGPPVMIGYVPVFRGIEQSMAKGGYAHYTHVDLAFANPDKQGRFQTAQGLSCMANGTSGMLSAAALRQAVSAVHKAGGKILVSVGGGLIPPCSGDWAELLRPASRERIVEGLVALVDAYKLDGVDVDIEGTLLTKIDRQGDYTPFIAALSRALKARGKLITCATGSYEGGMVPVSSVPYFDLIGVMAYDSIGPSWGPAGSEHSPIEQAERDLRLWEQRGAKREQIILGLPFYGYGFGGFLPNYNFHEIKAKFGSDAAEGDVIGYRCAGCSYITFNGLATLRRKVALARQRAGGLMVWEVTQDTGDHLLARTLKQEWGRHSETGATGRSR